MKTREIIIVVVALLLATVWVFCLFSCKDEAEAEYMHLIYTDDPIYDIPEPNEVEVNELVNKLAIEDIFQR